MFAASAIRSSSLPGQPFERHFQLNKRSCHHALAAKERQNEGVVARQHGADVGGAGATEAIADRIEQLSSCAFEARPGAHLDGENPAAGRRAEFPGPNLPDDKAFDAALPFGDEKKSLIAPPRTVALEQILPMNPIARRPSTTPSEVAKGSTWLGTMKSAATLRRRKEPGVARRILGVVRAPVAHGATVHEQCSRG
jgi:hypothetical protein